MLRDCFTGKNKTLRSLFLRRSFAARCLFREQAPVTPAQASVRRATSTGRSGLDPADIERMRERLAAVLDAAGVAQQRPNAMPLEAFLQLYGAARDMGLRWTEAPAYASRRPEAEPTAELAAEPAQDQGTGAQGAGGNA